MQTHLAPYCNLSLISFFFSLPYSVMPSGWIEEINVCCACVDVQNSQTEPATDLLLYLAKRHACCQETPSSEQPTGQPQPATDACQSHPQPNVQASICNVHATAKLLATLMHRPVTTNTCSRTCQHTSSMHR